MEGCEGYSEIDVMLRIERTQKSGTTQEGEIEEQQLHEQETLWPWQPYEYSQPCNRE